jgi:hypothetical protein
LSSFPWRRYRKDQRAIEAKPWSVIIFWVASLSAVLASLAVGAVSTVESVVDMGRLPGAERRCEVLRWASLWSAVPVVEPKSL